MTSVQMPLFLLGSENLEILLLGYSITSIGEKKALKRTCK